MKLAGELAGQEYSEQTIQLTRAQKLERFGFLFGLYSDLPPRTIPLFKLESVAMGRPDRANARVRAMSEKGHLRTSRAARLNVRFGSGTDLSACPKNGLLCGA